MQIIGWRYVIKELPHANGGTNSRRARLINAGEQRETEIIIAAGREGTASGSHERKEADLILAQAGTAQQGRDAQTGDRNACLVQPAHA